MKKIIFQILFISVMIGTKIILSSSSSCSNCDTGGCVVYVEFDGDFPGLDPNSTAVLDLPCTPNRSGVGGGWPITMDIRTTYDGWVFDILTQSQHYCEHFVIKDGMNANRYGYGLGGINSGNSVQCTMKGGEVSKFSIEATSPCFHGAQNVFDGSNHHDFSDCSDGNYGIPFFWVVVKNPPVTFGC